MINLKEIRKVLSPLGENHDLVLFGSVVENTTRPNSDIDIAVLTYINDKEKNKIIQKSLFGIAPLKFDIRVFELFPIYIQISIIKNYLILFGEPLEISEYFYDYYKKWDDCKHRILSNQFKNYNERLLLIK